MREILFRGKRADNGEWIYGYYFYDDFYKKAYITVGNYCMQIAPECPNKKFLTVFEVIPETVGQYTGLTDNNGKRIFEGDIIKIGNKTRYVFFGVCRYRHTNYGEYAVDLSVKDGSNCEVIGNIHDNPELIK
ncbi:MAG: YopX family protein [Ruminococcus sp.]